MFKIVNKNSVNGSPVSAFYIWTDGVKFYKEVPSWGMNVCEQTKTEISREEAKEEYIKDQKRYTHPSKYLYV